MLRRSIRAVRRKPKAVREQYALGLACTVTGLVVMGWLASGPLQQAGGEANVATAVEATPAPAPTPLRDLVRDMQNLFSSSSLPTEPISADPPVTSPTVAVPKSEPTLTSPVVRIATTSSSRAE